MKHRCANVTERLDLEKCGRHPVSKGGFGDVYQGVLVGGEKVAIKSARLYIQHDEAGRKALKVGNSPPRFLIPLIMRNNQDVAHELYVWSSLKHTNIVELIGLARFQDQLSMVSPWMENGSLPGYISRHPEADRIQLVSS
jgi:serine/threonine protein kinase